MDDSLRLRLRRKVLTIPIGARRVERGIASTIRSEHTLRAGLSGDDVNVLRWLRVSRPRSASGRPEMHGDLDALLRLRNRVPMAAACRLRAIGAIKRYRARATCVSGTWVR